MTASLQILSTLLPEHLVAAAIREGRDEHLVELIEHAQMAGGIAAEGVFAALRSTPSRLVRNAAALAIVDLNLSGGADVLAEVLARASVAHEAGTLLYALDEIGGSLPLSTFVTLVEHGSFEARSEALLLFEQGRILACAAEQANDAHDRLSSIAASGPSEAADAAAEALADWPEHLSLGR